MKKIRYGIVGLGNQGSYYLGLFLDGKIENERFPLYAIIISIN